MLGRGGMATVYLAHDQLVDRPVALKILRRELSNSVAMERFSREIAVIGRLRHAHIVPLHDSGVYDELPYYVMAYVEGESLQDRIARDGALPIADVVRFGGQVAEALAYAHREGVLHRDITPGNILIADDNAYVADFGIARLFTETKKLRTTESGFILGTPTYMSPEQASGEMECDGRSDIYSLGCVLYEATTGIPPFVGPTPQAIIAGRFGAPPPPARTLRADIPPELNDAIARAMMTAPAERFQSAAELGAALEAVAPVAQVLRARGRRRSVQRIGVAAAAIALLVLGVTYLAASRFGPLRDRLDRLALDRARALVEQGEWQRADTALRDIVKGHPTSAPAHLWLAQAGALARDHDGGADRRLEVRGHAGRGRPSDARFGGRAATVGAARLRRRCARRGARAVPGAGGDGAVERGEPPGAGRRSSQRQPRAPRDASPSGGAFAAATRPPRAPSRARSISAPRRRPCAAPPTTG